RHADCRGLGGEILQRRHLLSEGRAGRRGVVVEHVGSRRRGEGTDHLRTDGRACKLDRTIARARTKALNTAASVTYSAAVAVKCQGARPRANPIKLRLNFYFAV